MCAPAASWRTGTSRMSCSSSAASSGSISGDGRPKTKRTPSLARQRASSRPPFSSAIGHLLVVMGGALVPGLAAVAQERRSVRREYLLSDERRHVVSEQQLASRLIRPPLADECRRWSSGRGGGGRTVTRRTAR